MLRSVRERLNAPHVQPRTPTALTSPCSEPHHPPLLHQVTIAPACEPLQLLVQPHVEQVFETTVFSRVFFKHVSQAQLRSQPPAWGEQVSKEETPDTRARESFWKCWGGSFQSSLCHPRTGPTSQRNKRLLKLGRTTYPCSSVKWLLVAPHDTSSIRHSNAVLWHSFVFEKRSKPRIINIHLHHLVPLTKYRLKGFPWSCEQRRHTIILIATFLPEECARFPTGTKNKNNFKWGTQWTSWLFS